MTTPDLQQMCRDLDDAFMSAVRENSLSQLPVMAPAAAVNLRYKSLLFQRKFEVADTGVRHTLIQVDNYRKTEKIAAALHQQFTEQFSAQVERRVLKRLASNAQYVKTSLDRAFSVTVPYATRLNRLLLVGPDGFRVVTSNVGYDRDGIPPVVPKHVRYRGTFLDVPVVPLPRIMHERGILIPFSAFAVPTDGLFFEPMTWAEGEDGKVKFSKGWRAVFGLPRGRILDRIVTFL